MLKIAFFDAKEYDRQSFEAANSNGEFDIRFLETRLTPDTYKLAEGCDVVCVFVNDDINSLTVSSCTIRSASELTDYYKFECLLPL